MGAEPWPAEPTKPKYRTMTRTLLKRANSRLGNWTKLINPNTKQVQVLNLEIFVWTIFVLQKLLTKVFIAPTEAYARSHYRRAEKRAKTKSLYSIIHYVNKAPRRLVHSELRMMFVCLCVCAYVCARLCEQSYVPICLVCAVSCLPAPSQTCLFLASYLYT